MESVNSEIENAIKALGLNPDDLQLLGKEEGELVYDECERHFVGSTNRHWWWEDFKLPSFIFKDFDRPFEHLTEIMPDLDKNVWLIVEDHLRPNYLVYDVRPKVIGDVIGECYGFEYYIISKDKEWLICENHHDFLIGIGESLRRKNGHLISERKPA